MSTSGLLSPPTSAASPAISANAIASPSSSLPAPRQHPLKPGSQKEIALINYLDDKILRITRRYGKKFSNSIADTDDVPGYTAYDQVAVDIDPLIDVVWISGTGLVCSYMPAFPFSSVAYRVINKLDLAFSTMLQASITEPSSRTNTSVVSTTEKVRIKSLIDETRVTAVQVASSSGYSASIQDLSSDTDSDTETEAEGDDGELDQLDQNIAMNLSKVYKKTLEILGDSLA